MSEETLLRAIYDPNGVCYGNGDRTVEFQEEVISCSSSCTFGGCAYCGDTPGTGTIEGTLLDTLFQQPVPNARVALFYRGLQVNVTTSDETGYFTFGELDTHEGCDQYKIVVDSYVDNPLTSSFDESKRGGYLPVTIGPFKSKTEALTTAVTSAEKGVEITNEARGDRKMPQISMIPRLAENEYVVQLWWTPSGGYNQMLQNFRDAADKDAFYSSKEKEIVDLVVRVPQPYVPGTFASCALSPRAEEFNPETNSRVGRNQDHKYWAAPRDNCTSADWGIGDCKNYRPDDEWQEGIDGVDHADPVSGMYNCTNKIRATFSRTCTGGSTPTELEGKVGCADQSACRNSRTHGFADASCSAATAEPSRQGDIRVLNGQAGAYLFCFHPEYEVGTNEREQSTCGNFILPPQSVFITGRGGVYDILVNRYRLFESESHNPKSVRDWLRARNAKLQVYDKNGLYGTWDFDDINAGEPTVTGAVADKTGYGGGDGGWNNWDEAYPNVCTIPAGTANTGELIFRGYANTISPVWTPLSIDTTSKRIKEWNAGYYGADFRYFSDLIYRESYLYHQPGGGNKCWERTCTRVKYDDGTTIPPAGKKICSGNSGYSKNYSDPACDSATSSDICPAGSTCASRVDASVKCIKVCTSHSNCDLDDGFCGGIAGTCNIGSNPPPTR